MSKWIDKSLFNKFVDERQNDVSDNTGVKRDLKMIWPTPEKGTEAKPKIYEGRFLPDQEGSFYKKYYYHMHKSGENWKYSLCPKTYGMDNFCLYCNLAAKLYTGNKDDKAMAYQYKRKERYVSNFFLEVDERDEERADEDKMIGTVKLYEFPAKIESKLRSEITDKKNGLGMSIFDPSDDGYSFIIKVKSTKQQADGKVWPDYSDSVFARHPHAIAKTEKQIEKIMETCYNIDEYISSMEKPLEEIVKTLKEDMMFDLVEADYKRYMKQASQSADDKLDEVFGDTPKKPSKKEEPVMEDEEPDDKPKGDDSDEDILADLENL